MTSEIIGLLANLALTLSLIVALVFGIAQVRAAARDRRERFSLEALRSFQTRNFAYEKIFQSLRETQPDPFLGEYFQWLAEHIMKRMEVHPRRPFHESNSRR